jgi:1,4-dihydroxy-6-naphthoate synthase
MTEKSPVSSLQSPDSKMTLQAGRQNSKITLGFSPCPNDTFIFDALVHNKINTENFLFDLSLEDVETLNERAFSEYYDVSKLSFFAYALVSDKYQLLNSGSALGYKCGPLLISKNHIDIADVSTKKIAIPGKYTTANFLFSIAFPEAKNKTEMLFSEIETAIVNGTVDAGVIIHENRFTYEQKGLKKIIDLGEYWEKQTGMPVPLGGIAVKRSLPEETKHKIDRMIKESVEFAFTNPKSGYDFIKAHAQEMSEEVMYKHIGLYVNKYSVSLGDDGRKAIQRMLELAAEKKIIPALHSDIFI